MKSVRSNLRSGDFDLREAARAAARRAGMTLGEWLDEAVAERAARLRLDPEDLDESDQVEAIAARLGALPLDDIPPHDIAPRRIAHASPRRGEAMTPAGGRRPNMRLLDAAAARLGFGAESHRAPEDVIEVARRIAELEDALGRRAAPRLAEYAPPRVDGRLRRIAESLLETDAEPASPDLRRIEARLDRLAEALEQAPRGHKPRPDPMQGEIAALRGQIEDLARAVAAIGERAAKQNLEPALRDLLARIEASRADGVSEEALAPVMHMLIELRGALEYSPAATARAMGAEIAALRERLDALAAAGPRESDGSLRALREQVEMLARNLASLVARLGAQEPLHAQIAQLARRVEDIAAAPRELSERLVGLIDDLRQCVERLEASPAFRMLERRLEALADRDVDAAPEVARTLGELRESIDNLTDHPTMRALQMQMADLARITGETPRRLLETLEDLRRAIENMAANPALDAGARPAPLPGYVAESLAEIRLSLERLAANAGLRLADDQAQRLQNIEERVTEISEKLDAPPIIERIAGLQEALLARIDRLRSELPHDQLAALRARVEDVHRAVSQPALPPAPAGQIEDIVNQLATKLERAASAGTQDPRALQAIENQVLRIAERLDRHGETSEAIGALERSMADLFTQVSDTRQAPASNIGETIARDLSTLRSLQDETDRRTRATLEAVHETLEKVVDRLAMLESDVSVLRVAPRADAPDVPAVVAAPEAPATVSAPTPSRHDLALELSEPRAAQKSFIAAARRATQLMGAAPPPPRVELGDEIGPQRARASAAQPVEKTGLSDGSRKMMLGVAGLALSLGAYQLMREESPLAKAAAPQPPQKLLAADAPAASEQTGAEPLDPAPVGSIARPEAALAKLRDLAANGHAPAQFELAARLIEGRGVARDAAQAVSWLEKAAAQSYAPAQYRLGALYEKGAGVERSLKTASEWYERAAEAGHVRAMHNLGVLLAEGIEGRADYAAAAAMFRRAAEHGLRDSQYNLAVLHVRGMGVENNLVEAYKFFALAGAQGDADALNRRDEVAARMPARQISEARRAAESFALRTPDPAANEPQPLDAIVSDASASAAPAPAPQTARNADARVTSLK